jgi:hypothetical protein
MERGPIGEQVSITDIPPFGLDGLDDGGRGEGGQHARLTPWRQYWPGGGGIFAAWGEKKNAHGGYRGRDDM